jgi:hypothetical protein
MERIAMDDRGQAYEDNLKTIRRVID